MYSYIYQTVCMKFVGSVFGYWCLYRTNRYNYDPLETGSEDSSDEESDSESSSETTSKKESKPGHHFVCFIELITCGSYFHFGLSDIHG